MAYGVCPNCKQGLEVPEGYELCTCGACGQQISTALALELGVQPQVDATAAPEAPAAPSVAPVAPNTDASFAAATDASDSASAVVPAPIQQAPLNPVQTGQEYYAAGGVVGGDPEIIYDRSENNGLYLAAFILSVIGCVLSAIAIIPLAWTIPMTVHTYGIYKGKKANTTGFSVCMLIFCSLISGILLLVAGKDE